jgi:hypothetical protein
MMDEFIMNFKRTKKNNTLIIVQKSFMIFVNNLLCIFHMLHEYDEIDKWHM